MTPKNGLAWEVALWSQMIAVACQKDTRSLLFFTVHIFFHLMYCLEVSSFATIPFVVIFVHSSTSCRHWNNTDLQILLPLSLVVVAHQQSMHLNLSVYFEPTTWSLSSCRHGYHISLNIVRCGYPALNASYFDLSYHPVSTNVDCKLYKNARSVRCYDCDSCK